MRWSGVAGRPASESCSQLALVASGERSLGTLRDPLSLLNRLEHSIDVLEQWSAIFTGHASDMHIHHFEQVVQHGLCNTPRQSQPARRIIRLIGAYRAACREQNSSPVHPLPLALTGFDDKRGLPSVCNERRRS